MIKFFRNIRKTLLSEGKTSKYLKYAVGEIILVVVGILIALQINNWNEARKISNLEIDIIQELKNNLDSDLIDIDENIGWHTKSLYSSQIITKVIDEKLSYNDSLDYHFSSIYVFPMFVPTLTAYETLKQNGTRLIKNDSLRFRIVGLYERDHSFLNDVMNNERQQTSKDLHGLYRKEFNSFDWFGKTHPANFNRLLENEEYYNYVQFKKALSKYMIDLYNWLKEDIEIIKNLINEELERRK
jgi:hypothetical protein